MIFHLPGNDCSVISSNADTPFSSWWLKPGFAAVTVKASSLSPMVFMQTLLCESGKRSKRVVQNGLPESRNRQNKTDRGDAERVARWSRALRPTNKTITLLLFVVNSFSLTARIDFLQGTDSVQRGDCFGFIRGNLVFIWGQSGGK